MAVDQAHEQYNATIKSTSGGLELLNKDDDGQSILRAVVSLPEVIRIKEECEALTESKKTVKSEEHHESYSAFQKRFYNNVKTVASCFDASFNPFSNSILVHA